MAFASIIIPNWNGKQHLEDCLSSLQQQTSRAFEVLLVDNGSDDGSQAYVRRCFPKVRLIELGVNRGFTGACLAGYERSRGDFIILLNNDTAVAPDWLQQVLATFDSDDVGIVASKLLLYDRRDTLHAAGDFYRVDGIPGNRGVWQIDRGQYDRVEPVFSACGAAAAYRRTMLEAIGFLDDDFYFSCEDVDIGWRAQLSGWQVMYQPAAVVHHKLKATGGSVTGSYYDGRNFLFVLIKNYPTSLLRRYWRVVIGAQWGITRQALRHWRGAAARARLRGQLAALRHLPKLLRKRRQIQRTRRVSDDYLTAILADVDPTL